MNDTPTTANQTASTGEQLLTGAKIVDSAWLNIWDPVEQLFTKRIPYSLDKCADGSNKLLSGDFLGATTDGCDAAIPLMDSTGVIASKIVGNCIPYLSSLTGDKWATTLLYQAPRYGSAYALGAPLPEITSSEEIIHDALNGGVPQILVQVGTGARITDVPEIARKLGIPPRFTTKPVTKEELDERFTQKIGSKYNRPITPAEYNSAIAEVITDIEKETGGANVAIVIQHNSEVKGQAVTFYEVLDTEILRGDLDSCAPGTRSHQAIKKFGITPENTVDIKEVEKWRQEKHPGLGFTGATAYQFLSEKFPGKSPAIVEKNNGVDYLVLTPSLGNNVVHKMMDTYWTNKKNAEGPRIPYVAPAEPPKTGNTPAPAQELPKDWLRYSLMGLGGAVILGGTATVVSSPVTVPLGFAMMCGGYFLHDITSWFSGGAPKVDAPVTPAQTTQNTAQETTARTTDYSTLSMLPTPPKPREVAAGYAK